MSLLPPVFGQYQRYLPNSCSILILYLLIQKYSYYEYVYKRNEPISSILIDLLCAGSALPSAYSSHSVFTNDTFEDLKEIIRIAPQSLTSNYGQLRCRYYLSPLDMACHNINVPMYAIEYMLSQGADMYHYYDLNQIHFYLFYIILQNFWDQWQ